MKLFLEHNRLSVLVVGKVKFRRLTSVRFKRHTKRVFLVEDFSFGNIYRIAVE